MVVPLRRYEAVQMVAEQLGPRNCSPPTLRASGANGLTLFSTCPRVSLRGQHELPDRHRSVTEPTRTITRKRMRMSEYAAPSASATRSAKESLRHVQCSTFSPTKRAFDGAGRERRD